MAPLLVEAKKGQADGLALSADHSSTGELEVRSESTRQFAPVENESKGP